jgi:hypothetical protein
MDLSQLINSNVSFSKTTLEDIIARYSVKAQGSTSTTNKTPASVATTMSALGQAYARVYGDRTEDYGDLTWLTLSNLKKQSKALRARPIFEGTANPQASTAMQVPVEVTTLRKNIENFRSVLYSAAQHLKTVQLDDSERSSLTKKYNDAYNEFGTLSAKLMEDEKKRLLTREPSKRQQAKWINWPELMKLAETVYQYIELVVASPPVAMNVTDNKVLQRAMQFALQTMIPPLRNNFANLRFITAGNETMEVLSVTDSANYIVVEEDGRLTLVINKFKIDHRSQAVDFDPAVNFTINHANTGRFVLEADPTLSKFGFDPERLAGMLHGYRNLQQDLLGDRNPHDMVFYEIKRKSVVTSMSSEGMSTRMSRLTERLTGLNGDTPVTIGAQMFRTLFLSWFNGKRPTMPERELVAKRMMHSVETQLGTYTKDTKKRTQTGSGQKNRSKKIKLADLCI